MGAHIYVDETKAKSYVLVAVTVPTDALFEARAVVGSLVKPGQRSVHMKNESSRRRREIANAIVRLAEIDVQALVFDLGRGKERLLRSRGLEVLVESLPNGPVRVTFDRDETMERTDRRELLRHLQDRGMYGRVSFDHLKLSEEPLLTLPDAVAWCWARGGEWRRLISAIAGRPQVK